MALSQYKKSVTLRLYVYSDHGTGLDECGRISRIVGDLVDGTDLFESGYLLEVSSPGLDRPLKTARDFKFRIGETVRLMLAESSRKKLTAEIVGASDTDVEFRNDDGTFKMPLSEIEQATIVF
jgi:ribosome maturation factor RimP